MAGPNAGADGRAAAEDRAAHSPQIAEAELEAHREQQQHHPRRKIGKSVLHREADREALLAAADACKAQHDLMWDIWNCCGGNGRSPAHVERFADPAVARIGVLHGTKSFVMQTADGQIRETHSVSAGLDYPSVGPEHAWLRDQEKFYLVKGLVAQMGADAENARSGLAADP